MGTDVGVRSDQGSTTSVARETIAVLDYGGQIGEEIGRAHV